MATSLHNHRWNADENSFAMRVRVDNASSFFFDSGLVIEPGTRAYIVDEGLLIGEVPPGTYTLKSFTEKLKFWKQKQCTAILTRQDDIVLKFVCESVPTTENLLVSVHVRLTVQMNDVALFLSNLMGVRDSYSVADIRDAITPFLADAVRSIISQQSITEIQKPGATVAMDAAMDQAVSISLRRYGLRFSQLQTVRISHARYDEHQRKQGEIWLMSLEHGQAQQLDQLYHDQELKRVLNEERANQIDVMLKSVKAEKDLKFKSVEADKRDVERDLMLRRVLVRQDMRRAVQTDEFNSLSTAEERLKYLEARDKDRLLRTDEMDQLKEILQQMSEDRAVVRNQVVRKLELEQEFEIRQLQQDLGQQFELKRRSHEIELTKISESEESRKWRDSLERQADAARIQREERWKSWDDRKLRFRDYWSEKRDDQITQLLHETEKERIGGSAELERAERNNRVRLLEQELKEALERSEQGMKRLRDEYNRELAQKASDFQRERENQAAEDKLEMEKKWVELRSKVALGELDLQIAKSNHEQETLAKMQSRNMEFDRHQMELLGLKRNLDEATKEAQHKRDVDLRRLDQEFALLREDKLSRFRLDRMDKINDRIKNLSGMGVDGLLAFADTRNAAILADKEKERFRQETEVKKAEAAAAQAQATANASANASMSEAERAARDHSLKIKDEVVAAKDQAMQNVTAALERAMQMVHQNSQQSLTTISGVAAVHAQQTPQQPIVVAPVVVSGSGVVNSSPATPNPVAASANVPQPKQVVLCSNCRTAISIEKKFCDNCGSRI